jgi:amino acid transporter
LNHLESTPSNNTPRRQLTWFDSTSIIVGTIIGTGIYQTASPVASSVSTTWGLFGIWMVGGLFSLCGALCYAELASAFPRTGGDFVYLNEAYGSWAGFLFGWLQMFVIRPGDIAIIAFGFATYFQAWMQRGNGSVPDLSSIYAAAAVVALTIINILGVRQSKWVQNLLTVLKVTGLLLIVALAFYLPAPDNIAKSTVTDVSQSFPIGLALIFVLFTYGGWNEMAYLAAEVKQPERNLVRAFVSGTVAVTLIYLLVNGAFLRVLGLQGMGHSPAIATQTAEVLLPKMGGSFVTLLICISTLGTLNGMILTGSRISYALGAKHPVFGGIGRWNSSTGTPVMALAAQGVITLVLILLLGSLVSAMLYTSAAVYTFYLATSLAVPVLRRKRPDVVRPYRISFYPLPLIVFSCMCLYLIYSAIVYKPWMPCFVGLLAFVGLAIFRWEQRQKNRVLRNFNG